MNALNLCLAAEVAAPVQRAMQRHVSTSRAEAVLSWLTARGEGDEPEAVALQSSILLRTGTGNALLACWFRWPECGGAR